MKQRYISRPDSKRQKGKNMDLRQELGFLPPSLEAEARAMVEALASIIANRNPRLAFGPDGTGLRHQAIAEARMARALALRRQRLGFDLSA